MHSYYKLFSVQTYFSEHYLNILLDLLLTTGTVYDYMEIIRIPNRNNIIIIPETNYLLYYDEEHLFGMTNHCQQSEN